MPAWLEILLLALVALVALLALGGAIAARRREEANRARFERDVETADRALAAARAEDRGWDRDVLNAAARAAFAARQPGAEIQGLNLVQVIDRPGIEEDRAIFRVRSDAGEQVLSLGRKGGEWMPESAE